MRQVKSLMKNLEKSEDPMAHQHLQTLQQMMHQLNIEQSNSDARKGRFNALDQRQRHLNDHLESGVRGTSPQSARGLENSHDCDAVADMQYAQLLEDEKESLMQQNAIIRKILESQKKLSALKEQHDYVASVQKKAENKLAEAKALQDQLSNSNTDLSDWVSQMQRETAAGTLLAPPLSAMREPKRSAPSRRSHQGASVMSSGDISGGDANWSMSADSAADGASAEALAGATGGHPAGDLGLEQLDRRVQVLQGILAQHGKFGFADPEPAVEECELEDPQSSQLNENIRALQEQKSQVDQLLSELTALQSEASRIATQTNTGNLAAGSTGEGSKGDTAARGTAKHSTPYEHPSLSDKRRQVNEMRKTLQQLKSAVKNLDQEVASGAVGSRDSSPPTALMGSQQRPRGSAGYKKDNLQGDFPARRHYEAEGRANEEPDVVAGVGATAATAAVQQPSDLPSTAQTRTNGDLLAEKVSGEADQRKEQQRQCLQQQLQEQRLRLSLLRQQLTPSQQAPAKNQLRVAPEGPPQRLLPQPSSPRGAPAVAAASLSPAKKDNVTLPKNLYDASKASNRSHDHSSSNLESSGLSRDKAILEELLQQERSKQLLSYSHNEDVRSPSSCSASSEPMDGPGGSVMAGGNTTIAATWGGSSTQENLEDDEDDDEDRQEGSVEAGHDSDGSHSDGENDAARAVPPPLARKDRQSTAVDAAAATPGRTNNRLTSMHVPRAVNGTYGGGGQWGNWQGTAGYSAAPVQRQQSSTAQGEIVSPDDSGYPCDRFPGGASSLMMVPGWHQLSHNLIQQLENTNTVYQSILQEQQALATSAAAVSPGSHLRMPSADALQFYAVQQQLLLSIIHCYQLLSIQQAEISQLQQATHQHGHRAHIVLQGSSPSLEEGLRGPAATLQEPAVGSPFLLAAEPVGGTWMHGMGAPLLHTVQPHRPLPAEARGAPPGATLNNQVVPGSRANNFWDNFRSYSRQNLLSNPGAAPKTNELPANFQVQHSQPIPVTRTPLTKSWASSRGPRDYPPSYAAATCGSRSRQMRPVQNVWPQEPAGGRPNDPKQANGAQGQLPVVGFPSDAPSTSSRQPPSRQQQQQPACDVLKMSIGAEVSRLLEGKEDAASLAAVLRQLQLLNCPQPELSSGQAVGGARRKVPSSAKSNIPKENRALNSERHLMFQRGTSESSPDLVASVEFATDSPSRIEETLSDSTFDKNTSRPLAAVTARKRAKPLCSPASQPPQLPTVPTSSMERSVSGAWIIYWLHLITSFTLGLCLKSCARTSASTFT
ncbi:hypothetical protein V5799_014030 [Amblyomma americanum]|uniref:Uncharacterized protein n=1 Tax=Amblyomma americanum TaxID=6943 RepID=A0AAQ4E473_AMBAM